MIKLNSKETLPKSLKIKISIIYIWFVFNFFRNRSMIFYIWIVFQIYKRKIFSFQNFHCEKMLLFAYSNEPFNFKCTTLSVFTAILLKIRLIIVRIIKRKQTNNYAPVTNIIHAYRLRIKREIAIWMNKKKEIFNRQKHDCTVLLRFSLTRSL